MKRTKTKVSAHVPAGVLHWPSPAKPPPDRLLVCLGIRPACGNRTPGFDLEGFGAALALFSGEGHCRHPRSWRTWLRGRV